MGAEEVIGRILSAREGLAREDILRLVDDKKREAGGYLTDEGAVRLVASELGVELTPEPLRSELLIRDIVSGLNDVTVAGRVIMSYPARVFSRRDGTEGRVARLLIGDRSGTLTVALWDEHAGLVEGGKAVTGEIVRVLHGYVREGFDGGLELHVGRRGAVQLSPPGVADRDYPPVTGFMQRIGDLTRDQRRVSIVGLVQRVSPVSTFQRRDGTVGRVMRLWLGDGTGRIAAVLWNSRVDELEGVREGECLRLMDARVKADVDGRPEIHVEDRTRVERLKEGPEALGLLPPRFTKIGSLRPGVREADILARVIRVGETREFPRQGGETGRLATLLIGDETGTVRLNLWDDKAAVSKEAKTGDTVLVEKAYTRERFGETSLNLGERGAITLNPEVPEAEALPPLEERVTAVAKVREEGGPVDVKGVLETAPEVREVTTSRGETVPVASFELSDDTGRIRVSLWRGLVDDVRDLIPGTRVRIRNAYVRRGLADQLELTSRTLTSIEILSSG